MEKERSWRTYFLKPIHTHYYHRWIKLISARIKMIPMASQAASELHAVHSLEPKIRDALMITGRGVKQLVGIIRECLFQDVKMVFDPFCKQLRVHQIAPHVQVELRCVAAMDVPLSFESSVSSRRRLAVVNVALFIGLDRRSPLDA